MTYSLLLTPSPTQCHHWLRSSIQVKIHLKKVCVLLSEFVYSSCLFFPQRVEVRRRALWIQTMDVVTYWPQLLQIPSSHINQGTYRIYCRICTETPSDGSSPIFFLVSVFIYTFPAHPLSLLNLRNCFGTPCCFLLTVNLLCCQLSQ